MRPWESVPAPDGPPVSAGRSNARHPGKPQSRRSGVVGNGPERCGIVVVEHDAMAGPVAESGADQPGLGGHVSDYELDVGHALDRVARDATRQRPPCRLGLDHLDCPCRTFQRLAVGGPRPAAIRGKWRSPRVRKPCLT
jgi:hypothetical protein